MTVLIEHHEQFPHRADIGIRGVGGSPERAFEQVALALVEICVAPDTVRDREVVEIECQAPDRELLLVDWLNALIYEMATRRMVFCCFSVQLKKDKLRAEARGEPLDPVRHAPGVEVKGATYTQLRVRQNADGTWLAQCVVDV
jgi:SHS2 domain-containing protein